MLRPNFLYPDARFVSLLCLICLVSIDIGGAEARDDPPTQSVTRQAFFEMTFAHQDMIWHGDPASPNALAYLKRDAQPVATDFWVRTEVKGNQPHDRNIMRSARIALQDGVRRVYAFTSQREKVIGTIDAQHYFLPNEFYRKNRDLLPSWPVDPSVLLYDEEKNVLYYKVDFPGPSVTESLDHLPLELVDKDSRPVVGHFSIEFIPPESDGNSETPATALLRFGHGSQTEILAKATLPVVLQSSAIQRCSFDNTRETYFQESSYRPGAKNHSVVEPAVTFTIEGEWTSLVQPKAQGLMVVDSVPTSPQDRLEPAPIVIDGHFGDWRNIPGVDDPRGDLVPYLEYVPDVDLLELKVSHDQEHLYLYARVAGQVGRSHPQGGRSYFYAYLDVDQNAETGFLPSRDDDCYFGVDLGDDCEVQFEFVNNALRKTFYGFCGIGGNENVLKQQVVIGKSQYGRYDEKGVERSNYKSEYIYRNGITEITEDLKLGTSDTIRLALSPDGHEVEVVSTFSGFLKNPDGKQTVQTGQTLDLAVGMECDSKWYPAKKHWAADSTKTIHNYELTGEKK